LNRRHMVDIPRILFFAQRRYLFAFGGSGKLVIYGWSLEISNVRHSLITIVTGKAGSGKSTALAAFEDSGYYCVDNLPVALLPVFLQESSESADMFAGLVFGMDIREKHFVDQVKAVLSDLQDRRYRFRILFLEADEKVLLRRYSQTRRKHPLASSQASRRPSPRNRPCWFPCAAKPTMSSTPPI